MRRWVYYFDAFFGGFYELHSLWDITKKLVDVQLFAHFIQIIKKEGSLPMSFMNCQMVARRGAVRSTVIAQMIPIETSWNPCEP